MIISGNAPWSHSHNGPYSLKKNNFNPLLFQYLVWVHKVELFFLLFLKQFGKGNNGETKITSAFNTSPNLIHHFELVKWIYKTQEQ